MELLSLIPDNLSELLVTIVRFTELRRDVLYENIHNTRTPGYTPKDMPVLEFVQVLNGAIAEHVQRQRLLFCDTENIKFGRNSAMKVTPVMDAPAKTLLHSNRDEYVEAQVGKLLENSLNRKVAKELLRLKCGAPSHLASLPIDAAACEESAPPPERQD
jgi:flagellar basal body rod protein FlgB